MRAPIKLELLGLSIGQSRRRLPGLRAQRSPHAAVLDERGALLSTKSFPTTTPGYRQLLDWLSGLGEIDAVAIESTGSYAAALVRYLREHDITVVEVNQPHAHTRRRVGKSDPIDAEMAARLFQAGKAKRSRSRPTGSPSRFDCCASRATAL